MLRLASIFCVLVGLRGLVANIVGQVQMTAASNPYREKLNEVSERHPFIGFGVSTLLWVSMLAHLFFVGALPIWIGLLLW